MGLMAQLKGVLVAHQVRAGCYQVT